LKPDCAHIVVFADLDGALLNDEYSCESARQVVDKLRSLGVSVVFCSSKTLGEVEFFRRELGVSDPFVVENGGAVFVPRGYFPFPFAGLKQTAKYDVVELGLPYGLVREKLARIKLETGAGIVGFGDLSVEELAAESGLPLGLALLAKRRRFDEPCRLLWGNEKELLRVVEREGLSFTRGGRYFHLLGGTDKGRAACVLKELFVRAFAESVSFGVGDSPVDLPMLRVVDVPLLVPTALGGEGARLVVWRNLLRLVEVWESSVWVEQRSILRCRSRIFR